MQKSVEVGTCKVGDQSNLEEDEALCEWEIFEI